MRKTTSQTDLEEEASKKQSMSKCPQENSTHIKKSNQCQNALKKTQHISKKHNFCYLTIQKGFF